jgi:hypothetical protein
MNPETLKPFSASPITALLESQESFAGYGCIIATRS